MSYYQTVYAANLTPGFNDTNFLYSISTKGLKVDGTFSGKLKSLYNEEVTVSNGSFNLNFATTRNY